MSVDITKHKIEDQPDNPYDRAGIISKTSFFWLNSFIKKGFKKDLILTDLYKVPREDESADLGRKLKIEWDKELALYRKGGQPSFVASLCRSFGFWYLLSGIWITIGECIIRPIQAISLGWIINDVNYYGSLEAQANVELSNEIMNRIFYKGLILIFLSIISLITVHPYVFCTQHTGMKVRIACCHLIYRHCLKLSNAAIGQTTVGQMVNLLSNDVNRFDVALNYIQYLVIAPLQAIIAVAILSTMYLGFYSTAAGSALLLLYVPFQSLMGRWFGQLRQATASRTDERIRLMNEIIPAMRVIKMYTWEDPFANLVELARKNEVRLIRYTSILRGINMALFFVSSKIILFICFMTYILLGYTLDAEIVFVSITIFNAVRLFMTLFFPYGVAQLAETLISCSRLQEFLLLPEQEPSHRVDRGVGSGKHSPDGRRSANSNTNETLPKEKIKVECQDISANWTIINKTFKVPDDEDELRRNIGSSNNKRNYNNDFAPKVIIRNDGLRSSQRLSFSGTTTAMDASRSSKNSLFASTANVHLTSSNKTITTTTTTTNNSLNNNNQPNIMNQTAITALRNISYQVKAGELMIIVGRVGSGKSSVLLSILGELPLAAGRLTVRGRLSYAAQEPWIFAGSVRENVLFGKEFNELRYNEVLRVCSLDKDIKLFPYGDETIVGERGVSLSGGQRARINLARAIYFEADIYLLDDPLSAVDSVVAQHIFNECISGFLKDKAVLLATHQTQFVRKDTRVLFLRDGRQISCKNYSDNKELQLFIGSTWERSDSESAANLSSATKAAALGSRKKLVRGGVAPSSPLARVLPLDGVSDGEETKIATTITDTEKLIKTADDDELPDHEQQQQQQTKKAPELDYSENQQPPSSSNSLSSDNDATTTTTTNAQTENNNNNNNNNNQQNPSKADQSAIESTVDEPPAIKIQAQPEGEDQLSSSPGCSIYWHYLRACQTSLLIVIVCLSNIGTQALFNGSDFWLSYWTDTEQRKAAFNNENNNDNNNNNATTPGAGEFVPQTLTDQLTLRENALVYTILIASLFVLTLIRTTRFFVACMRSSINLHNRLFESVIKAPIKFFDYNPIGVLLNRVSRDMGIIDDLLPPTAFDTIEIAINVLGILITIAVINPINIIPAIVLCAIVAIIRLLYIRTVRSIKSMEGTTRSPVFSHLATSLNGLATIRAFKVEPEFEKRFDEYQDVHSSAWFLFVSASRWLGCSLDWICIGYIAVITLLMTLNVGSTTGAQIGLAISSALALSGSFQWGVRQSTELESQMTSVARIREYSQLPEEPARESPAGCGPAPEWPQFGAIEFKGVNLRYFGENEEPVLKELTFKINAGEKIGIVGRTGAGKSSIIAVLFRLTEPEGSIVIDDLNTKSIGLHELRKKLSIIPQEPILFNGPIRRNLDPFNEYADLDLWRALEQVKLAEVVRNLPGQLEAELNEGGSNFSVGERQLICLARAVLRQNRIIILDEATANVDPDTDKFIQRTINDSFANCTRLTIAHRLNTIMDSDRVLVMDSGRVREFDVPHLLLQQEAGFFATMVKNTGKNAAHLRRIARAHYERKMKAAGRSQLTFESTLSEQSSALIK